MTIRRSWLWADTAPTNVVSMQDSTLEAVKKGMLGYTQPGGSVYNAFRNCVVTAGAKTGISELGGQPDRKRRLRLLRPL